MLQIHITETIRRLWPDTAIGALTAHVVVHESPEPLRRELDATNKKISQSLRIEEISSIPEINAGREAYKSFGKKPARYRLSSEALLRRILKGQEVQPVNNIVDINNLISLVSGYPICAFDLDHVYPPATFTLGEKDDDYEGIGRGRLNIERLPVFGDMKGKFGSPTSDSERVKVTEQTHRLSMNIISFSGRERLKDYLDQIAQYLVRYAEAEGVEKGIIMP